MSSQKVPFQYGQAGLENDVVALEPFDPGIHTAPIVDALEAHPEILTYTSFPAIKTIADFTELFYDKYILTSSNECLYVIIDKLVTLQAAREARHAGYAGLVSVSAKEPIKATIDIGAIIFLAFQRTHVTSNAIGLVLLWALDSPSTGGLGLRRVEWKTHAENAASRRTATRMGFELEGVIRWDGIAMHDRRALSASDLGARNGTQDEQPGQHTAIFSIVWDEWESKRAVALAQMKRKV